MLQAWGAGDELHAFPPNKDRSDSRYHALRRLDRGATKKSTAHRDLHMETQSVVMSEGRRICDELGAKIDQLRSAPPHAVPDETIKLNIIERADALNVAELRELLAQKGFPCIGKKRVLLTRVANEITANQLEEFIQSRAGLPPAPKKRRAVDRQDADPSLGDTASTSAAEPASSSDRSGTAKLPLYIDGDRANTRRTIIVLEHNDLAHGPRIRVEEEDAANIGRELSSYYLSKMEDVRLLETSRASASDARTRAPPSEK